MDKDGASTQKIDYGGKLQLLFKSYGDLAERLDFAYWWSCIGKGLRLHVQNTALSFTERSGHWGATSSDH